jgi:putative FmdB family regulatory protein
MPTYDYFCTACNSEYELFHSMLEAARTVCERCQQPTLERKIGTGGAIIFKGSGFYETDYKKSASESKASQAAESQPAVASPNCGAPACASGTCASVNT